jgi:hypothetical protein
MAQSAMRCCGPGISREGVGVWECGGYRAEDGEGRDKVVDRGTVGAGDVAAPQERAADGVGGVGGEASASVEGGAIEADVDWRTWA